MKIYVASKFEKKDTVSQVMNYLREGGHEVVADWTKHTVAGLANAPLVDRLREFAEADLGGVEACDCLVFVHAENSRGGYVELGAALGMGKLVCVLNGRPSAPTTGPIFYFHPRVHHFDSLYDLGEFLKWSETAFVKPALDADGLEPLDLPGSCGVEDCVMCYPKRVAKALAARRAAAEAK